MFYSGLKADADQLWKAIYRHGNFFKRKLQKVVSLMVAAVSIATTAMAMLLLKQDSSFFTDHTPFISFKRLELSVMKS